LTLVLTRPQSFHVMSNMPCAEDTTPLSFHEVCPEELDLEMGSFKKEHRTVLSVQDACCQIKRKGAVRQLLQTVSFTATGGQVFAIMGPSGAGKTTLLNLVALETGFGECQGVVQLNGKRLTTSMFAKHCSFVPSSDDLLAYLSAREILEFAASFQHCDHEKNKLRVDSLLKDLGLEACQHTKVGNTFKQGLSAGQKKRTSLAIALVKEPLLLMLDEPTSSLDAAAAAKIMLNLAEASRSRDIVVVCSIHQPSAKVFNTFDKILLLTGGQTAYLGTPSDLDSYLDSIGHPVPNRVNPAEFVLDLLSQDFTGLEAVEQVLAAWRLAPAGNHGSVVPTSPLKLSRSRPGLRAQVAMLFYRQLLVIIRDPTVYTGRMTCSSVLSFFFAILYYNVWALMQSNAPSVMFCSLWFLMGPTNLSMLAVYSFSSEFMIVKREIKSGMYSFAAYFLVTSTLQLPFIMLIAMCSITGSAYGFAGWQASSYPQVLCIFSATLWCFENAAHLCSVLTRKALHGSLALSAYWFISFALCGVMIREEKLISPLQWLAQILPWKYAVRSAVYSILVGTIWEGAVPDPSASRGFQCPKDDSGLLCWGYTGEQVSNSLGVVFGLISPDNHFCEDMLALFVIGLVMKLAFAAVAAWQCHGRKLAL